MIDIPVLLALLVVVGVVCWKLSAANTGIDSRDVALCRDEAVCDEADMGEFR